MPHTLSNKKRTKGRALLRHLGGVLVGYLPYLAMAAEWDQKLTEIGRTVRIGMYAVGGSLALITLMWSGIKWLIARSNGDHSHTFIDYLQQLGVVGVVGGTLIFGAWAWGVFGSGTIA